MPSKTNLLKRQVITSGIWEICQTHHEDVTHALYLCPKLEAQWNQVPLWNHSKLRHSPCFVNLLADNRDSTLFSMVIWALWNLRNNLRLGKQTSTLEQILQEAKEQLLEFTMPHTSAPSPSMSSVTSCCPPDTSRYKINFDVAIFDKANCVGVGVVIRNEARSVMASLSQQIPLPFIRGGTRNFCLGSQD